MLRWVCVHPLYQSFLHPRFNLALFFELSQVLPLLNLAPFLLVICLLVPEPVSVCFFCKPVSLLNSDQAVKHLGGLLGRLCHGSALSLLGQQSITPLLLLLLQASHRFLMLFGLLFALLAFILLPLLLLRQPSLKTFFAVSQLANSLPLGSSISVAFLRWMHPARKCAIQSSTKS
eukprot:comp21085_c0_seq1/m.44451 comp21085_c0_seq1/g.44451  ORF comp21085_c0_seq1/g.44451 comp21085_c0_seq1/m.44451 type:complete len:175 (+) comp21085_c0_seq1:1504-2028(+)